MSDINQRLLTLFPDRTLESIKGQRNKNHLYREILLERSYRSPIPARIRRHRLPPTPNYVSPVIECLRQSNIHLVASTPRVLPSIAIEFGPHMTFSDIIRDSMLTCNEPVLVTLMNRHLSNNDVFDEVSNFVKSTFSKPPPFRVRGSNDTYKN